MKKLTVNIKVRFLGNILFLIAAIAKTAGREDIKEWLMNEFHRHRGWYLKVKI
ncbi:MAG: hypothetical protein ACRC3H_23740 [Lachnospiraceae bacterium]